MIRQLIDQRNVGMAVQGNSVSSTQISHLSQYQQELQHLIKQQIMKDAFGGTPAITDTQLSEQRGVLLMIPETGKMDMEVSSLSSLGQIRNFEDGAITIREDIRGKTQSQEITESGSNADIILVKDAPLQTDFPSLSKSRQQSQDFAEDSLQAYTQCPISNFQPVFNPSRFKVKISRNTGFQARQTVTDYEMRLRTLKGQGNANPFQKLIDTLQSSKQCSEHFDVDSLQTKGPGVIVQM